MRDRVGVDGGGFVAEGADGVATGGGDGGDVAPGNWGGGGVGAAGVGGGVGGFAGAAFSALCAADAGNFQAILVLMPDQTSGVWSAVADRLLRATEELPGS